jgi:DnaJ-class molecular chaperone
MAIVAQCRECMGEGTVEFTKERGGPKCNHCNGKGYLTRAVMRRFIASILDHPSVYMSGPSQGNLKKADRILDLMVEEGVALLPE